MDRLLEGGCIQVDGGERAASLLRPGANDRRKSLIMLLCIAER